MGPKYSDFSLGVINGEANILKVINQIQLLLPDRTAD